MKNPIHKVLSLMQKLQLKALVMGGQACIFYGGAEYTKDLDLVVLVDETNLKRIQILLDKLKAENIAVPKFKKELMLKGHSIHFRAKAEGYANLRIDLMNKMRGVDEFEKLWERRTTVTLKDGTQVELISLPDLVKAKKTQRDKDWPMIRRLVEADYFSNLPNYRDKDVEFWLRESRTPQILIDLYNRHKDIGLKVRGDRPILNLIGQQSTKDSISLLNDALRAEEEDERRKDREYWEPLKKELERLRHDKE